MSAVHGVDEFTVDGPAERMRLVNRSSRTTHVVRESNWRSSLDGEHERWTRRAWNQRTLCGSWSATVVAGEWGDVTSWAEGAPPVFADVTCRRCAERCDRRPLPATTEATS